MTARQNQQMALDQHSANATMATSTNTSMMGEPGEPAEVDDAVIDLLTRRGKLDDGGVQRARRIQPRRRRASARHPDQAGPGLGIRRRRSAVPRPRAADGHRQGLPRAAAARRRPQPEVPQGQPHPADGRDRRRHRPGDGRSARRFRGARRRGRHRQADRAARRRAGATSRRRRSGSTARAAASLSEITDTGEGGSRQRRCRTAEGHGERGAGHPLRQPADRPRRRGARLGHPHRAVREQAARPLSHRRHPAGGGDAARAG